jgi:phenylpropionate dioxygenase-like ring-hydroxylating dioxygenase large terminal subunit
VGRYGAAEYVSIATQDFVWRTNWKLLTENFMESYHLPVAHRKTLGSWLPLDDVEFPSEVHDAFTYETFTKDESARYGRAHPANTRLEGRWRFTSVMPTVYPTGRLTNWTSASAPRSPRRWWPASRTARRSRASWWASSTG